MFALVFVVLMLKPFSVSVGNEFRCVLGYPLYRSFHFRAYPNSWFSLCMAKRSVGMVLVRF
uniref:Secreted protein n=1 Tax=Brassica oleracea TaxID=3712 RepID=A0A3P6G3I6_BRAOL|nr:unnamed protein product [Brassica oleracea]